MTKASDTEITITAVLSAALVGGLYSDGWAHLNVGGLDSFFTPWHGLLYASFTLLAAWLIWMVWRRRWQPGPWAARVPEGYRWGVAGVVIFAGGGFLDMSWHLIFGIEVGVAALVSPTHLLLLTGGLLLVTSPLRGASPRPLRSASADPAQIRSVHRWSAVVSMAVATALAGFFVSYLSAFTEPGATQPLVILPESAPEHYAAQLPAIAGLGGYLVSTLLLVVPLLFLSRRAQLPAGTVTLLVGTLALSAAALNEFAFPAATFGAVGGALVADLVLALRPHLAPALAAGLVPGLVWSGQLLGLALAGQLRWSPELWAGVVTLSILLSLALEQIARTPPRPRLGTDAPVLLDQRR